jgi:putative transposase
MPRQPRLDAPGLLQHVMARGIEGREIFKDDQDRSSFLERLAIVLEETQTQCYAWSLIPNHFHLLLRTSQTPLSKVMRRLMTGYAVTFNKRHKRSGHLFQNRYKSVVCEEDPYLLELIRYIHLNPLRAGLVNDLRELDKYPWTGHSGILGRRKNPLILPITESSNKSGDGARNKSAIRNPKTEMSLADKTTLDVLLYFGDSLNVARRRYRQFVKQGVDQGTRPELQGGGLVRSAGGDKVGLLGRKKHERELGDERILGSGDFVTEALQKAGQSCESRSGDRAPLETLADTVSKAFGVSAEQLKSGSRRRTIVQARSVLAWIAVRLHGYNGVEIAEAFSLSSPTVSRIIEKGEIILDNNRELAVDLRIK